MKRDSVLFILVISLVTIVYSQQVDSAAYIFAGVGCNDTQDLNLFKTKHDDFHGAIRECASDCYAMQGCTIDCLVKFGLTKDCATCFYNDIYCTAKNCPTCTFDPDGQTCLDCSHKYCWNDLVTCCQVDASLIPT